MLCVFSGAVFQEIPPIILAFFRFTRLRFFVRRVFRDELSRRSGVGGVVVF